MTAGDGLDLDRVGDRVDHRKPDPEAGAIRSRLQARAPIADAYDHTVLGFVFHDHFEIAGAVAIRVDDHVATRFGHREGNFGDPIIGQIEPLQVDPKRVSDQRHALGISCRAELKTTSDRLHFGDSTQRGRMPNLGVSVDLLFATMDGSRDTVTLRVHGAIAVASLAEPLVVTMGARAGVDVVVLDELVAALELVARATSPDTPRTVVVESYRGSVHVTIDGVDVSRLRGGRAAIESLVAGVDLRENEVSLRVGG